MLPNPLKRYAFKVERPPVVRLPPAHAIRAGEAADAERRASDLRDRFHAISAAFEQRMRASPDPALPFFAVVILVAGAAFAVTLMVL